MAFNFRTALCCPLWPDNWFRQFASLYRYNLQRSGETNRNYTVHSRPAISPRGWHWRLYFHLQSHTAREVLQLIGFVSPISHIHGEHRRWITISRSFYIGSVPVYCLQQRDCFLGDSVHMWTTLIIVHTTAVSQFIAPSACETTQIFYLIQFNLPHIINNIILETLRERESTKQ